MKRPRGAPSRSVKSIADIKAEMIRQALAQEIASNKAADNRAFERQNARSEALSARDAQEVAAGAAEMFRGYGRQGQPSMPLRAREMSEMLGVIDPKEVKSEDLVANVRAIRRSQVPAMRGRLETAIAEAEAPGILERLSRMRAGVSGLLAEDGTRGDIARVGVVTAATGGSVMGLTAAGQGLMALMEYIQNGTQQQESRESTLA